MRNSFIGTFIILIMNIFIIPYLNIAKDNMILHGDSATHANNIYLIYFAVINITLAGIVFGIIWLGKLIIHKYFTQY
ncbi:hypothetical protein SAMN02746098_00140 [Desulfosporosinus lacus DSM 15449]|uniref:DUF1648 domain-containing protein n=1 Tax=Desulfosporosinus lacus DSM 15449 TaxID=1121420 RepID=A0A1M5Q432_9FIRM|nr:hypothetical protein SAMN02746098_00140 [Desulfosporosinus lacus DSM 15449]